MAITIQGPDGASIDFPDGTSEGEMNAAMAQAYPAPDQGGGVMGALKGASRALEANLPFVDRAVAAAKGGDYASNLSAERLKNEQFAEQNPWTNSVGGIVASAPLAAAAGPTFGLGGLGGRVASSALPWAVAGGVEGASSSPDLTNVPETAKDTAIGGAAGGALGAAVPLVAAGVGKAISPLAAALRSGPGAADVAKLGEDVTGAYQKVKDLGAAYSPGQVQGLIGKITSDAAGADIDPLLNPKASNIIRNLQTRFAAKIESGDSITLGDLDRARQFVNDNLGGLPEPKQARFGAIIKSNIDDFIKSAEPQAAQPRAAPAAPNFNPASEPDANYVPPGSSGPGEAPGPQRPVNPGGSAPPSLVTFLSRMGVKDEGGDLASMGFTKYPGLVRPLSGVPMDEARRAAAEAGYLDSDSTVSDLLDKVAKHPTYAQGADEDLAQRRGEYRDAMSQFRQARDEARPSQLVVARNLPGESIQYGKPGQIHADLLKEGEWYPAGSETLGFAEPGGPFMSRQEAADFLGRHERLTSQAYNQATPSTPPDQVPPAPSAADAHGAIQTARSLAMRQFKAKALADALSKAEINADVAGTGGNIENATRRRLASILDKEPWSPDETDQINRMIHGTPITNTLRQVSRFGPKGNALMAALEMLHGSPGIITAAAGGTGAQAGEAFARRAGQQKLLATILAGGKAPAAPAVGPGPSRAALAAALAARQQLPPQRNTER